MATTKALGDERVGFGSRFRAPGLRLTANVATRLDKKLRLPGVFAAGQPFASATTVVEPATVGLAPAGKLELALDPGFAAKLGSFFVAANPIFPAEHPGAFTFPIGGGVLAPGGSSGQVKTTGGLEFIRRRTQYVPRRVRCQAISTQRLGQIENGIAVATLDVWVRLAETLARHVRSSCRMRIRMAIIASGRRATDIHVSPGVDAQ